MERSIVFLICLVSLFLASGSSSASTIDFSSNEDNATLLEFTVDGIDIDVTASWDGLNENKNIATVSWAKNGNGLGVTVNDDDKGGIDGKNYDDYLFFTFSENVILTEVLFGGAQKRDEFDLFVDEVLVLDNGETTSYWSSLNSSAIFQGTEFAFRATDNNDNFRVKSLEFEAAHAPEPGTMVLFGVGLLSLAGISRKKK